MDLEQAIKQVRAVLESEPSLTVLLRDVQSGAVDPEVAAEEIMGQESEEFTAAIKSLAGEVVTALEVDKNARQEVLDKWGVTEEDLIFQPDPDRPTVMLNPLYQALIAEVLQFDGDLPELRTGHLPEGGTPAVPVKTTARSPVVLGAMLKKASEQTHQQLKAADAQLRGALAEAAGMPAESALAKQDKTHEVRRMMNIPASIPGYGPGQKAAMVQVSAPSVQEIRALSFGDKQTLFHKALTSTQGRRSAAPVIGALVLDRLHKAGFAGASLVTKGKETPAMVAEWTISIDGWKGEVNPRFSYIDNAAASLSRQILEEISGKCSRYTHLDLCVECVNTVSESRVGWNISVFER